MKFNIIKAMAIRGIRVVLLIILMIIFCDYLLGWLIEFRTNLGRKRIKEGLSIYPAPYTMTSIRQDKAVSNPSFPINAQGFSHPVDINTNKEKIRVFIIGGSFAMGVGGSGYTNNYLKIIRQRFPDIEFINGSGSSFIARQQFVHFALNVLPWDPDGLIIIDGFNDLGLPLAFGQSPGSPWQWNEYKRILSGHPWHILCGYVQAKSQIYRLASRLYFTRRAAQASYMNELFQSVSKQYIHATKLTYDLCRARNIDVFHVFQPNLAIRKKLTKEESKVSLPNMMIAIRELYPRLAEESRREAEINSVGFLSLLDIYSSVSNTVYVDFCHVNDLGQEIAGNAIGDMLQQVSYIEQLRAKHLKRLENAKNSDE